MRPARASLPVPLLALAFCLVAACDQNFESTAVPVGSGATPGGNDTTPAPPTILPTIAPTQAALHLGDTLRLTVTNAAGAALTWRSSQPAVVAVVSASGATALVQGTSIGTSTITAAFTADPTRQGVATISVSP